MGDTLPTTAYPFFSEYTVWIAVSPTSLDSRAVTPTLIQLLRMRDIDHVRRAEHARYVSFPTKREKHSIDEHSQSFDVACTRGHSSLFSLQDHCTAVFRLVVQNCDENPHMQRIFILHHVHILVGQPAGKTASHSVIWILESGIFMEDSIMAAVAA
jgi:hypothetical protein